jgi:putative ABC transport system substrate-binding protein
VNRREFIAGLGAAAWSAVAWAQEPVRVRRIGVLMGAQEDDPGVKARLAAFQRGLRELGWVEGRNARIDSRFAASDRDLIRKHAAQLVSMNPDVILAQGTGTVGPLQQVSRAVPIVFAEVVDPIGGGLVESLARPGGNSTGFISFEYGLAGKWLELLKQIAPNVTRAAVLRNPTLFASGGQLGAIQAVAPSLGVEVSPIDVRDVATIERSLTTFARGANGGLIILPSFEGYVHRDTIFVLAARHRLPAVYPEASWGSRGLISYGPDIIGQFRQAADYVDRILRGENPAELPVQAPAKFLMTLNLKTAKALGLTIPETLLATADEVIQ